MAGNDDALTAIQNLAKKIDDHAIDNTKLLDGLMQRAG